jgi:hypothetical protein
MALSADTTWSSSRGRDCRKSPMTRRSPQALEMSDIPGPPQQLAAPESQLSCSCKVDKAWKHPHDIENFDDIDPLKSSPQAFVTSCCNKVTAPGVVVHIQPGMPPHGLRTPTHSNHSQTMHNNMADSSHQRIHWNRNFTSHVEHTTLCTKVNL